MRKKRQYTEKELKMIRNTNLKAKDVANSLNVSNVTIYTIRKYLNVKISTGPKSGPRPYRYKREIRTCIAKNCNNKFEVKLAQTKKYCSTSCQMRTDNPSWKNYPRKIRNSNMPEYIRYRNKVHALSQKVYEKNINIINPERHIRTLCGVKNGWQLDHIITIKESFNKGKLPEEVAIIENLRMLPWKENLKRNNDSY